MLTEMIAELVEQVRATGHIFWYMDRRAGFVRVNFNANDVSDFGYGYIKVHGIVHGPQGVFYVELVKIDRYLPSISSPSSIIRYEKMAWTMESPYPLVR